MTTSGSAARVGHLGVRKPVREERLSFRRKRCSYLLRHDVEQRQDMITGEAESIFHAFELKCSTDEVASRDSRYGYSPESLNVVSSITSPKRLFYEQAAGASAAIRFVQGRIRNKTSSAANSSRANKIHKTAR